MDTRRFDAITRRASLLTLGTAGLATLATLTHPHAGEARKKKKRKGNKADSDALCKKQVEQCASALAQECEDDGDDPQCPDLIDCCSFLGTCNVDGFLVCVIEVRLQPSGSRSKEKR